MVLTYAQLLCIPMLQTDSAVSAHVASPSVLLPAITESRLCLAGNAVVADVTFAEPSSEEYSSILRLPIKLAWFV